MSDKFSVDFQAEKTHAWLKECIRSMTPSNAKKLLNRLQRNKEKCPSDDFQLIYFDADRNISLYARDFKEEDGNSKVVGVGFFGLSMKFHHKFDKLSDLVLFFYSTKAYWEIEINSKQEERNKIKDLSSRYIKEGKMFEDGSIIQDTWGNFVVSIKKPNSKKTLSRRLCLINDNLYIEEDDNVYLKLINEDEAETA